jgi:hypothetical protein
METDDKTSAACSSQVYRILQIGRDLPRFDHLTLRFVRMFTVQQTVRLRISLAKLATRDKALKWIKHEYVSMIVKAKFMKVNFSP